MPPPGVGPVLRPSGGPGPAGEAGVGAVLPQPAGDGRSEARSRRAHLPGPTAQPWRQLNAAAMLLAAAFSWQNLSTTVAQAQDGRDMQGH